MFFTMTAAIGGALTALAWSIEDGVAAAALATGAAGLASAAAASVLMVRLERRMRAKAPKAGTESVPADLPRLRRPRSVRFAPVGRLTT